MFLLKVTNSNGDQIRQEFLSGKVVLSELRYDTVAVQCSAQVVWRSGVQCRVLEVVYALLVQCF